MLFLLLSDNNGDLPVGSVYRSSLLCCFGNPAETDWKNVGFCSVSILLILYNTASVKSTKYRQITKSFSTAKHQKMIVPGT
jgi:hypothetical protein